MTGTFSSSLLMNQHLDPVKILDMHVMAMEKNNIHEIMSPNCKNKQVWKKCLLPRLHLKTLRVTVCIHCTYLWWATSKKSFNMSNFIHPSQCKNTYLETMYMMYALNMKILLLEKRCAMAQQIYTFFGQKIILDCDHFEMTRVPYRLKHCHSRYFNTMVI